MMRPLAAVATLSAVLLVFAAGPAGAQQQLAPIATAPAAAEPAAAAEAEAKKAATSTKGRRWLKADARVCLEFPNDMQVIKCSENYR